MGFSNILPQVAPFAPNVLSHNGLHFRVMYTRGPTPAFAVYGSLHISSSRLP